MELRHLRFFVAVAEEGSVTLAAEKRLHTAQPSLSRQLRALEQEVGVELFVRGARGMELTAAGRAFLDHARLALGQANEAVRAARRAVAAAKASFSVGFLIGQEVQWLPHVTRVLRAELPNIELRVTSLHSRDLADALQRGELDAGFLRVEDRPDVEYRVVTKEKLLAIVPSDHRLAAQERIAPQDFADEVFIGFSDVPHVLRGVVSDYFRRNGVTAEPSYHIDNVAAAISLVASVRGVALLPAYVEKLLPWSVVSRALVGETPTIDLVLGYRRDNRSPVLRALLDQIDVAG